MPRANQHRALAAQPPRSTVPAKGTRISTPHCLPRVGQVVKTDCDSLRMHPIITAILQRDLTATFWVAPNFGRYRFA